MPNYEKMSIEQLEKANEQLIQRREAIKAEQRLLAPVLDKKLQLRKAEERLSKMTKPQQEALKQVVRLQGVETGEDVISPAVSATHWYDRLIGRG